MATASNMRQETPTLFVCSKCFSLFPSKELTKLHQAFCQSLHFSNSNEPTETSDEKSAEIQPEVQDEDIENVIYLKLEVGESRNASKKKKKELWCEKEKCQAPSFPNKSMLKQHSACHTELSHFQCTECHLLVPTWSACAMHLYQVHQIDCNILHCSICKEYSTYHPISLENHMRIHGAVRAFVCHTCGQSFQQQSELRNHNVAAHNNITRSQDPQQCNICYKIYSNSKALHKHKEEVHNRKKPFVCNVCGHATARKWMLQLHQRQHTGQKPYQCTSCTFSSPDQNSLRRHMMAHNGLSQYRCDECGYRCIRSSNLKSHMQAKHPDVSLNRIHACSYCSFSTVSSDRYTRHVSDHLTGTIKGGSQGEHQSTGRVAAQFSNWINENSESILNPSSITVNSPTPGNL